MNDDAQRKRGKMHPTIVALTPELARELGVEMGELTGFERITETIEEAARNAPDQIKLHSREIVYSYRAAFHMTIDGEEYVIIVQPTHMMLG